MSDFTLNARLAADTLAVGDLPLCSVRLMDDSHYPWLILVPRRSDIEEIYQLSDADQQQLLRESSLVSRVMAELFAPDKLNVGALGNIVRQLHLHHVARFEGDAAWPGPVWGAVAPTARSQQENATLLGQLRQALGDQLI